MNLAEKIIKIRQENNLTQDEMAQKLFVTRQAISKYERGISYPSLDVIYLISKEFKISLNELLDISEKKTNKDYKPIGFKHYGFIIIYLILALFVTGVIIGFNLLIDFDTTKTWEIIFYNILLGCIDFMVIFQLVLTIFPISKILIEYNDFGLKIKTFIGTKEIPFLKITNVEIKTHGNWNAGRLIVRTFDKNYTIYPIKDLNQVKTIIDEIKILNKY